MPPSPPRARRFRRPLLPFSRSVRRASLATAALLVAAVAPVACGESRDRARVAALEAGIASAQASLAAMSAGAPAAPPSPQASFGALALARPAPAEVAARLPAGARPLAAAELLGTGPDALLRWFGEPDLRRAEGDAEVMLFLGPGCALDVVLYAAAGGGKRVAHAAARADGPAAVTEADCLRGIGGGDGGGGVGGAVAAGHTRRR